MATNESIETEIDKINGQLAAAERLKEYKATLEAMLQKAKSAMETYPGKYPELLKRWQDQDRNLKDLLAKLPCSIQNWEELLRRGVTPLFKEIADLEDKLGTLPEGAEPATCPPDGLYAQRERQQLQLALLETRYDKARLALVAWEKPAPALEKILVENDRLAADLRKSIGLPEAPALLFDVFFKLLPMHYLVAPPDAKSTRLNAEEIVVRIAGERAWTDLTELLGPQPTLIEPGKYLDHILNYPFKDYNAAKTRLAEAAGALRHTEDKIKSAEKALDEKRKSLGKAARAALLAAAAAPAPVKQPPQAA